MYRSMSGLGLLQTSTTGISSSPTAYCITAEEKAEAASKCKTSVLRGVGATQQYASAPMTGRLAGQSPCDIVGLPVCPTPQCLDAYTAGVITQCIAGVQGNPDLDCGSLYAYALSQLPFCGGGQGWLQPLPACLPPELAAVRTYCNQYPGFDGPNKALNAGCWAAMHDPSYAAQVRNTPACADMPHAPQTLDPPRRGGPVAPPSGDGGGADNAPPAGGDSGSNQASMSGMLGILALVAAAGGGYYLYRRYKK